jgi:chromosome partitioning protein
MMVSYAISAADLVIIPVQGSELDANEGEKTIRLIKLFGKPIPYALLYTRTPASPIGQPKNLTHIQFQAHSGKVPAFQTSLHNLEAFKSIFSFGGSLETLPKEVRGVESAISNAKRFATETVEMLRATLPKKAAVNG